MLLSVEEMRRIVRSGDLFLLVDVRPVDATRDTPIPRAIRVPFGRDVVENVLASTDKRELPVVVCGDGPDDPIAEGAARLLSEEGFKEVWTYSSAPAAWGREQRPAERPFLVVSDPDRCLNC